MIDSSYIGLVGGMLASDSPWICAKRVGINQGYLVLKVVGTRRVP